LGKYWLKWDLNLGPPARKSNALPIRLQRTYIDMMKNSWYKTLVYIFMAQLVTANPKLFSKSTDQELSESVVKVPGNSKFTRLDVREQWDIDYRYNKNLLRLNFFELKLSVQKLMKVLTGKLITQFICEGRHVIWG